MCQLLINIENWIKRRMFILYFIDLVWPVEEVDAPATPPATPPPPKSPTPTPTPPPVEEEDPMDRRLRRARGNGMVVLNAC